MNAPLVVLSDLHLVHDVCDPTAHAFSGLLGDYAGHEVVLDGDIFSLSNDPRTRNPIESVCTMLGEHPELINRLRTHLTGGGALTIVAGNHDAALTTPGMREALLSRLELTEAARLTVEPWFARRGSIHIEHGHIWDPDNAPSHPLAPWSPVTEPLGIQLTRRFVAKHQVWEFAHAHETTLVQGLLRAYHVFGPRMPALVMRYFSTSFRICVEALFDRGLAAEQRLGEEALLEQSKQQKVELEALRALLAAAPKPTHTGFSETFLRLYYDRVFSALGIATGALLLLLRQSPFGMALALGGGAYWTLNVKSSGSRYQNMPVRRLREGAELVAKLTDARLVVFGHTHVPELGESYANAGSFGYPASGMGRPYLWISPSGTPELRRYEPQ